MPITEKQFELIFNALINTLEGAEFSVGETFDRTKPRDKAGLAALVLTKQYEQDNPRKKRTVAWAYKKLSKYFTWNE